MTYIPKRYPQKALIYILCLFITGVLCVALSTGNLPFKWLFQFVSLMCLVLFIQSVTRYFIYEYRYIITQTSFAIVQKSGKKEISLCNVNLSTGIGVYTKKEFKAHKKEIGHIKTSYNYTQNFMSDNKIYYVFEFNNDKYSVAFEADEIFTEELKKRIKQ